LFLDGANWRRIAPRIIIALALFSSFALADEDKPAPKMGPNNLQDVTVSELRDNMTLLKIFFALPLESTPMVISEEEPPVIQFLFKNVAYERKSTLTHPNAGSIRSVKVEQKEGEAVAVTLYLKENVKLNTRVEHDQFVMVLNTSAQIEVETTPDKVVETKRVSKPKIVSSRMARDGERNGVDLEKVSGSSFYMFKGDLQILRTSPVTQVALGDGTVVSVSPQENGDLLVVGEKAGVTMLRVWHEDGMESDLEIHVTEKNQGALINNAAALLSGLGGVRIRHLGELIVVEGSLDPKVKTQVEKIAKAIPELVDLTTVADVSMTHMIHMEVKLIEFSSNALENLGINWDNQIEGPRAMILGDMITNPYAKLAPPDTLNVPNPEALPWRIDPMIGYLGLATSITSKINIAVLNGDAYVLATPTLSTRSGGEANFLSGGEVPLPSTSSIGSSDVKFKEYGIKLSIKPVADDLGNIRSIINTEISTLDASVSVNGIPGFLTRKTDAEINVKDGETMVISGLVNKQTSRSKDKVPLFGDIPILGWLFRSEEWNAKSAELVIFVTPKIVDPSSEVIKSEMKQGEHLKEGFDKMFTEGIVN